MKDYSEKRQYKRYDHNTSLYLYEDEPQDKDKDNYSCANMSGYSSGGMSFRTNEKLKIGQQVYIKTKYHDEKSTGPEKYTEYSGYIKWSDELGTSIPGGQYGYGIQYAKPVYY